MTSEGYTAWRETRMCTRKKTWQSQHLADIAGQLLADIGKAHGGAVRSYECPYCSGFHLTSKDDREDV